MSLQSWMWFYIGEQPYAIPLDSVAEVTMAAKPRLIPLVPMEVGGVLNVRGEPLPSIDGAALFGSEPDGTRHHVLVLQQGRVRVGILVSEVSKIAGVRETAPPADAPPAPPFVRLHLGCTVALRERAQENIEKTPPEVDQVAQPPGAPIPGTRGLRRRARVGSP